MSEFSKSQGRKGNVSVRVHVSGQIIATSHDLTPNGGLVREIPLFQGNLGWWNIIIWPECLLVPETYDSHWVYVWRSGPKFCQVLFLVVVPGKHRNPYHFFRQWKWLVLGVSSWWKLTSQLVLQVGSFSWYLFELLIQRFDLRFRGKIGKVWRFLWL